ncbi:MAG: glycosyltransferase family 4 protein [Planctomycetales bacterium]
MKILLLSRGNSIHTVRWANSLAERGIQVGLASLHPPAPELSDKITFFPLKIRAPFGYFLNVGSLRKVLKTFQPDLLHAHYASGYGTLGMLAGFHPYLVSVWGSDVFQFPNQAGWKKKLIARTLQKADWVCSTSHVMERRVRELCPDVRGTTVTPFGVDLDRFRAEGRAESRDSLTIGTVKALKPEYGIDTLLRGFAMFLQKQRSGQKNSVQFRLRIVGGGTLREEMQALSRELGITGQTEFIGAVPHDQVPAELRGLDVYVAASREESFGVAILEASACGCPVIVTDVGGLPEVVKNSETGLIIPKDDPGALADALCRLVDHPAERQRMSVQGRKFVSEHYEWNENVGRMLTVYEGLCAVKGAKEPASALTSSH